MTDAAPLAPALQESSPNLPRLQRRWLPSQSLLAIALQLDSLALVGADLPEALSSGLLSTQQLQGFALTLLRDLAPALRAGGNTAQDALEFLPEVQALLGASGLLGTKTTVMELQGGRSSGIKETFRDLEILGVVMRLEAGERPAEVMAQAAPKLWTSTHNTEWQLAHTAERAALVVQLSSRLSARPRLHALLHSLAHDCVASQREGQVPHALALAQEFERGVLGAQAQGFQTHPAVQALDESLRAGVSKARLRRLVRDHTRPGASAPRVALAPKVEWTLRDALRLRLNCQMEFDLMPARLRLELKATPGAAALMARVDAALLVGPTTPASAPPGVGPRPTGAAPSGGSGILSEEQQWALQGWIRHRLRHQPRPRGLRGWSRPALQARDAARRAAAVSDLRAWWQARQWGLVHNRQLTEAELLIAALAWDERGEPVTGPGPGLDAQRAGLARLIDELHHFTDAYRVQMHGQSNNPSFHHLRPHLYLWDAATLPPPAAARVLVISALQAVLELELRDTGSLAQLSPHDRAIVRENLRQRLSARIKGHGFLTERLGLTPEETGNIVQRALEAHLGAEPPTD